MSHEKVETNIGLMAILIVLVISVGGLVEFVPLFALPETTTPAPGVKKYDALAIEGRDVFVREGCYNCHSQMIRPFRAETERYGHYSVAGESVYDHPFQWGSKRTGPDLARVGGRYSDDWHEAHLMNPRDVVPESNMPRYSWLADATLDGAMTGKKMAALNIAIGATCPSCDTYSDADIAGAAAAVSGKTELQAVIHYLQGLGLASKQW